MPCASSARGSGGDERLALRRRDPVVGEHVERGGEPRRARRRRCASEAIRSACPLRSSSSPQRARGAAVAAGQRGGVDLQRARRRARSARARRPSPSARRSARDGRSASPKPRRAQLGGRVEEAGRRRRTAAPRCRTQRRPAGPWAIASSWSSSSARHVVVRQLGAGRTSSGDAGARRAPPGPRARARAARRGCRRAAGRARAASTVTRPVPSATASRASSTASSRSPGRRRRRAGGGSGARSASHALLP